MAFELAIVGMDCRFPESRDLEEYWRNLRQGRDCGSAFDPARYSDIDPQLPHSPNFVGSAYELADIDKFDAAFFGIAGIQAAIMSPQHRLILESAWNACEHAGYNPLGFRDDVGVFVGCDDNTYFLGLQDNPEVARIGGSFALLSYGNSLAFLPAWVSYKLNLRGPSFGVHAGCSSSLAAVHLACNSLLLGECKFAIATAVAANVPQRGYYHYEEGGIQSADGRCRPFDAAAGGSVYGNGVGTVVIKRLADALVGNDTIHAVIKGSAMSNDGAARLSFAAPNADGWSEVIRQALINSDVDPGSLGYVEAHGVGTPMGDAMEIEAMTKAFGKCSERKQYCAVGSVKGNVGHLRAAGGMAGLLKVVGMLKDGLIPPVAHLRVPNPRIDFAATPFFVNSELTRWRNTFSRRRAAVSAFGIGGSNAHLVLEQAPVESAPPPATADNADHLLLLSARTADALQSAARNLRAHLQGNRTLRLADVAYTLISGREFFAHRSAYACSSADEAVRLLEQAQTAASEAASPARPAQAVFVLTAASPLTIGLSRGLYAAELEFKQALDDCGRVLQALLGSDFDLHRLVYEPATGASVDQLASFVVQYALARVWISSGVRPVAMIGRGITRFGVAALCGTMDLQAALRLALLACNGRSPDLETAFGRGEQLKAPGIPFSVERGAWITPQQAVSREYWLDSALVEPAESAASPLLQLEENYRLVEVGLATQQDGPCQLERQIQDALLRLPEIGNGGVAEAPRRTLLRILGHLWEGGVDIRREHLLRGTSGRRVPLPTYPFERKRYWIDPPRATSPNASGPANGGTPSDVRSPVTSETEATLLRICERLLGMPELNPAESLLEMGASSLQINQLRTRIREQLGVELSLQTLFEYPSVRDLCAQIEARSRLGAAAAGASALQAPRRSG